MGTYHSSRRAYLAALLEELKNRGMEIPPELLEGTKFHLTWPVDESGFFRKEDGHNFVPYPEQKRFVESRSVLSLFKGGRGSGKSASGAQKALRKIMQGESGAVLNPDFENLKVSTWPEFREWIPWNLVVPRHQYRKEDSWQPLQPFTLVFKNGAKVIVKGLKDPSSARGPNINWLWYDEGGRDTTGMSWKIALASVRVGKDPQAWVTTTPNYEAPWIEEFFIQQKIPQDALEVFEKLAIDRDLVEAFHGTIYDNENNLNPVFMATMLAAYPAGWLRKQEIMGEAVSPDSALGDRSWFDGKRIPAPLDSVTRRIRYYDMAGTEKKLVKGKEINDPDETVGTKMSLSGTNKYIEHQACVHADWDGVLRLIRDTALRDGPDVKIYIEQEPGSGGKNQVAAVDKYLKEQIPGHPGCEEWKPTQDRVILANLWFAEAKAGDIYIVDNGTWDVEGFLSQLDVFPSKSRHDDRVTSVTGARMTLAPIVTWKEIEFMSVATMNIADKTTVRKPEIAPTGGEILLL